MKWPSKVTQGRRQCHPSLDRLDFPPETEKWGTLFPTKIAEMVWRSIKVMKWIINDANLCSIFTALKCTVPGLSLCRPQCLFISFNWTQWATRQRVASRRSRSFKVNKIGTNQNPACNLVVVFHCNCVSTLYRFRDITTYWSIVCDCSPFYSLPVSFEALAMDVTLWPCVLKLSLD